MEGPRRNLCSVKDPILGGWGPISINHVWCHPPIIASYDYDIIKSSSPTQCDVGNVLACQLVHMVPPSSRCSSRRQLVMIISHMGELGDLDQSG